MSKENRLTIRQLRIIAYLLVNGEGKLSSIYSSYSGTDGKNAYKNVKNNLVDREIIIEEDYGPRTKILKINFEHPNFKFLDDRTYSRKIIYGIIYDLFTERGKLKKFTLFEAMAFIDKFKKDNENFKIEKLKNVLRCFEMFNNV